MRVIAGKLGGRRLAAPRGLATRPTTDRVREALFSALGDLGGARVLDLYAGTGALGIEALSRGAELAVFVESARPALAALRENLGALSLEGASRVLAVPVARALPELTKGEPFDLVLADPPWADLRAAASEIARLVAAGGVAPGGRVVLEHARRDPPPDMAGVVRLATRVYGDTALTIFQREGRAEPGT